MRAHCIVLIPLLTWLSTLHAQDSIIVQRGFKEGIFVTYDDLRHNRPLTSESIITDEKSEQLEFYSRVPRKDTLVYKNNGGTWRRINTSVFGYFQNNVLYVSFKGEFYRVPVFGAISYFVAKVRVAAMAYDPVFGVPSNRSTTELRNFLMSFYNGEILEMQLEDVEKLLMADKELYAEFSKLNRSRRKDQVYSFIRRFNERHPLYFLK